jgi:hypothetical protein
LWGKEVGRRLWGKEKKDRGCMRKRERGRCGVCNPE